MINCRWVKTSKSDFLEMRENNTVLMRLTKEISLQDIVVAFTANDVVHVYALENGDKVVPEEYGAMGDRAQVLIAKAAGGTVRVMGQLWMNKPGSNLTIANVTLGAITDGRFNFSAAGLTRLECTGYKYSDSERLLNRMVRLEVLHSVTS